VVAPYAGRDMADGHRSSVDSTGPGASTAGDDDGDDALSIGSDDEYELIEYVAYEDVEARQTTLATKCEPLLAANRDTEFRTVLRELADAASEYLSYAHEVSEPSKNSPAPENAHVIKSISRRVEYGAPTTLGDRGVMQSRRR